MRPMTEPRRGTLLQHGADRLRRLRAALGFDRRDEKLMLDLFSRMAAGWGAGRLGGRPTWPSDITDDHTPFELSVAIDGDSPELRILAEVQADRPNAQSNWNAALAFNEELAADFGVSFERFRAIGDLFVPTVPSVRFGLWHAVCFRPGETPDFKVYVNPHVRGRARAKVLIEEAMRRLGFGESVTFLPPSTDGDLPLYFSLDLADGERARVKAYTGHYSASADHVEEALFAANGYVPGQVAEFCRAMGGPAELYDSRPVQTCLAFTAGNAAPTSGTVYFPVRSYADSDLEVRERVLGYMHAGGMKIYTRALETFANRPLEEGIGMQSYVSLRQGPSRRRMTVYLSPEVYAVDRAERSGIVSGVVARGPAKPLRQAAGG